MPVREKAAAKKQLKRERILEAAATLFSQKSYHEVMMEDVAKIIDVAKGTVYNYYASKEELYFSIMSIRLESLLQLLQEKISSVQNSIDSLRLFTFNVYNFMMNDQSFFLMYKKESLTSDSIYCNSLRVLDRQLKDRLAGIIRDGIKENVFRKADEEFTTNSILGSIFSTIDRNIALQLNDDQKNDERQLLFEFILHALHADFDISTVLPLKDKTIVLTRTVEQSKESVSSLTRLGAEVIVFPTLEIVPPPKWDGFDSIIKNQDKIDFIIFTSAYAVQMFSKRCNELKIKIDFTDKKIVALGNKTFAICKENEIPVNIIPAKFIAEAVVEELSKFEMKNKVVLIPRSANGREELPRGLKEFGAIIKSVPVYNVSLPTNEHITDYIEMLNKNKPDLFIFTSPSTFENFLRIVNAVNPTEYFKGYDVAAIGPTTKTTIENRRVKVNIMPDEYTIDGLIKKIIQYYKLQ